ncbi:MAG: hypothetical protein U0984_14700 [Prosthecobacter sp.]|nr:hypothetical protein [Prosthecobacter sp.]
MPILINDRHGTFARALADGCTPAVAYNEAGFSPKTRRARSQALSEHPSITTRVAEIHIQQLSDLRVPMPPHESDTARPAMSAEVICSMREGEPVFHTLSEGPPLLGSEGEAVLGSFSEVGPVLRSSKSEVGYPLDAACGPPAIAGANSSAPAMPQTRKEMLAWFWAVANGTRSILPGQMRAAQFFAKMQGWALPAPGQTPTAEEVAAAEERRHLKKMEKIAMGYLKDAALYATLNPHQSYHPTSFGTHGQSDVTHAPDALAPSPTGSAYRPWITPPPLPAAPERSSSSTRKSPTPFHRPSLIDAPSSPAESSSSFTKTSSKSSWLPMTFANRSRLLRYMPVPIHAKSERKPLLALA